MGDKNSFSLEGRHFGVVFDLGSSGSRANIFAWKRSPHSHCAVTEGGGFEDLRLIPGGTKKIKPGVGAMKDQISQIGQSLNELWEFLQATIPVEAHADTPVFMFATAGLRVVAEEAGERLYDDDEGDDNVILDEDDEDYQRGPVAQILIHLRKHVSEKTPFQLLRPDHIRVLQGEEEALFDYLTLQQMVRLDSFARLGGSSGETWSDLLISPPSAIVSRLAPLCSIDLGGASTQIAFPAMEKDSTHTIKEFIRAPYASDYPTIFAHSFLDYGIHRVYERYRDLLVARIPEGHDVTVKDPCMFVGSSEMIQRGDSKFVFEAPKMPSFDLCKGQLRRLFEEFEGNCADPPCAMSQRTLPEFPDLSELGGLRVVAMDHAYRVASTHGRKGFTLLGHLIDDVKSNFALEWNQAKELFPETSSKDLMRLNFEGLYLTSLLHYGYGFSKETKIAFADSVDGQSLSWALGAMVHNACILCEHSLL